jgi:hypothetical protein
VVGNGARGFVVPVRGELARRPAQSLQHPVVADPVHGESPSNVAENDVLLALVLLDDPTAGRLGGAPAAEVRGEGATGEIFVIHGLILARKLCLSNISGLAVALSQGRLCRIGGHPHLVPLLLFVLSTQLKMSFFSTTGLIFFVIGVDFSLSGALGHPVGGRRYWY